MAVLVKQIVDADGCVEHTTNAFAFVERRADVRKCRQNFSVVKKCNPEPRSGLGIVRANIIEYAFEIS